MLNKKLTGPNIVTGSIMPVEYSTIVSTILIRVIAKQKYQNSLLHALPLKSFHLRKTETNASFIFI
jgi:hypothetical protein